MMGQSWEDLLGYTALGFVLLGGIIVVGVALLAVVAYASWLFPWFLVFAILSFLIGQLVRLFHG